ncbi:MAG: hypothetical protein ABSG71_21605 [Thermodesulfobacteriota bacterium]
MGGYLRDLLLEIPGKDYDFALPKDAASFIETIEEALRLHFFKVGKEEMNTTTYRIIKEDMSIDLTFLQGETIEADLQRRDFTINTIAFFFQDETFHWMEGSLEDIEKKLIRTVSNHSIDQDPLRMLRAIRYLCTLDGFVMDKGLKEEISLKKEKILSLPGERRVWKTSAKMNITIWMSFPIPFSWLKKYHGLLNGLLGIIKGFP